MKNKEYGGFLPIELQDKGEYFTEGNILRFNCANAAINKILENISIKRIFVPNYMCPNVCANLENTDFEIIYYSLNSEMLPIGVIDDDNSLIYVTDYFGTMSEKTDKYILNLKKATVIADFCHAFFHKAILKEKVFNIYSARKFFGVADGAYLVSQTFLGTQEKLSCSSEYASYLLKSLEYGTNYCYSEKKDADRIITENHGSMSHLSKKILCGIDYMRIKEKRQKNAETLHKAFRNINVIEIENESIPYVYPLNFKKNIKSKLVAEKIYVPTLWQRTLNDSFLGTLEYELSDKTIFLPIDQRYNEDDMQYIISVVTRYI